MSYIESDSQFPDELFEDFYTFFLSPKKKLLNIKECKNAMRSLGILITEKEIVEILKIKDKNKHLNTITLEQFKELCKIKQNEDNTAKLIEAFENFDKEGNGCVKKKELKHAMMLFKPKMTEEEIEQILSEFKPDKDGNIYYRNYLSEMKNNRDGDENYEEEEQEQEQEQEQEYEEEEGQNDDELS